MEIKGLSRYDVAEQDGTILLWSRKRRKYLTLTSKGFHLRCDDNRYRCHTVGHLRYLMMHPAVDACSINLQELRIRFREDGTPIELYGGPRGRRYSNFRDLDDVQKTVDIMREVSNGKLETIIAFLSENRESAVWTVAHVINVGTGILKTHLGRAEEDFLKEVKTANVQRIMPLYAWLCKCIKCAYLRSKRRPMLTESELTPKQQKCI